MWVCIVSSVENCSNNLEYRYVCSINVAHSVLAYVLIKKIKIILIKYRCESMWLAYWHCYIITDAANLVTNYIT